MDVIDKINMLLCECGKTGADLCRELGLSNGVYSQWNTRKTKPSKKTIRIIADYFGVTVDYLLGNGEKEKDPAPIKESEVIPKYSELSEENRALVNSMIEKLLKSQSI